MMENFTYRQKNYFLLGGALVLFVLIYQLAIKNTLKEVDDYEHYVQQIDAGNNAHSHIWEYQKKLSHYENHLGLFNSSSQQNHEHILEAVSNYCEKHKLTIETFPTEIKEDYVDFSLSTHIVEVRGNFKELLQLVYHVEKKEKLGRIASLRFEKKLDRKTRRTILTATIYLQNTSL